MLTTGGLGRLRGEVGLSSSEKLRNLVFLPFLGCKGISHLNYSCVAGSVGYNMLYRMMRLDSIDWRNVQARFNKHLRKYLESHTEKEKDGVVCLVADDTDIAKSGRKMEHIGRVYSHTEHRHILGFKGLVLGRNDGKTFIPLDFSLHAEKGKDGNQGLSSKDRKARFSTDPGEGTPASVRHKRYQPIWEMMHKLRSVMGERDAMYELFTSET